MKHLVVLMLGLVACQFQSGVGSSDSGLGGSSGSGAATGDVGTTGTGSGVDDGTTSLTTTTMSGPATTGADTDDGSSGAPDPSTGDTGESGGTTTSEEASSSSTGEPPELQVAEELLVSLNAVNGGATPASWVNEGSLDNFEALGTPSVGMVDGVPAVTISQNNIYRSMANPPATLVEPNSTRTIEVWVINPDAADQESVVAWGRRNGGDGTLMVFGYGTQPTWGAVNHWGMADLGWSATPQQNVWHHLVYTFDGEWTRVYVDGELDNEEFLGEGAINTIDDERILVGAQTNDNGDLSRWASVSLAKVRIHAGALTSDQVATNYAYDLVELGL
jgi:hypothetical protein